MTVVTLPTVYYNENELWKSGKVLTDLRYPPACSVLDEYQVRRTGIAVLQDYSKESRVKPLVPELLPTARPRIYRKRYRYQLVKQGPTSSCWNVQTTWLYTRNQGSPTGTMPAGTPNTNWETKARLQIKDRSVNLAENLFEFRSTAGMFYSAGKAVVDAWRTWKGRKRWRKMLRPCDVAASELVYSFGINPLIGTLHDSYYALQEKLADPLTIRIAGGASAELKGEIPNGYVGGNSGSTYLSGRDKASWYRRQRYVIYVTFNEDQLPSPFTMGNPIELAWELVPYSWLVDGLNVGDVLSSLDALKGVKEMRGTLTTRDRKLSLGYGVPGDFYHLVKPGVYTETAYQRDLITTIPLGTLQYTPSKSWRKIMHAVSALTVINQRCKAPGDSLWVNRKRR